jgi:hypothetical protein
MPRKKRTTQKNPKTPLPPCLYPDCNTKAKSSYNTSRRIRGLCPSHYTYAQKLLKRGAAKESDLMARGLLAERKPRGSGERENPSGFLLGSSITGNGQKIAPKRGRPAKY